MKQLVPAWLLTLICSVVCSFTVSGLLLAHTEEGYAADTAGPSETISAFIRELQPQNGKTVVVFDPIDWLTGAEADEVFQRENPDADFNSPPDGYYIVNDNEELRTLETDQTADALMQIYKRPGQKFATDIVWNEQITLSEFLRIWKDDELVRDYPYHLTVKNGKIVQIAQQYVP